MSRLMALAWLNIAVHLAAMAFAALGMRQGTPIVPLEERMAYLGDRPIGWQVGWGFWMACALLDVAFVAALARRAPDRAAGGSASLAVILAATGAAVDLLWDTVHILVLPMIAADPETPLALFRTVERAAWACGAVVANGLYSAAVLAVTHALAARPGFPASTVWLARGTFASGMLLVAAGVTGDPRHLEVASAPTIGFFVAWTWAVARAASGPGD